MCKISIDNLYMKEGKKMKWQKCIKELSEEELFARYDNNEVELDSQFNWGGRTHYWFYCPACQDYHLFIGREWGVVPNQPALGWQ
jgi:hypothetical protein